jgi:hypothetical protein
LIAKKPLNREVHPTTKNFEQRNPTKKTFLYAVPTTAASSDNSTSSDSSKSQNCHIQYIYTPTVPNPSRTRSNLVLSHHRTTCRTPPLIIENAFATKTAMIFILSLTNFTPTHTHTHTQMHPDNINNNKIFKN